MVRRRLTRSCSGFFFSVWSSGGLRLRWKGVCKLQGKFVVFEWHSHDGQVDGAAEIDQILLRHVRDNAASAEAWPARRPSAPRALLVLK